MGIRSCCRVLESEVKAFIKGVTGSLLAFLSSEITLRSRTCSLLPSILEPKPHGTVRNKVGGSQARQYILSKSQAQAKFLIKD